jgi:hypothetical protein
MIAFIALLAAKLARRLTIRVKESSRILNPRGRLLRRLLQISKHAGQSGSPYGKYLKETQE